eukprot:TRINITY_DN10510_c0_g3_i2.p2 TRINITY_DN10510_c0_g3~~TRINITY_DN10510_c0_g3_i2.p2  ORF type:complete len:268 (+),score=63.00 TRINITY_DN10510_c0_g3_i2:444-1247(+)
MIRTVVELEKCTLEGEIKSEKAMGDTIFKLQMRTNLHEAALNMSVKNQTLFETFLHTVLYSKYKRVLPNLLKYVLDALEMLTEEMSQELNSTIPIANEMVVRKEMGTQTEKREERKGFNTQEEPIQSIIPLTQRQSKLIKRKYVPNIMSKNPKRQKLDMDDKVPFLQNAKLEPKLTNPELLSQHKPGYTDVSQLRRKTSVLYKGTFGSRLFLAKRAKRASPTGQLSESLLSRINGKVIGNLEAEKGIANEERKPEITGHKKDRKGSM